MKKISELRAKRTEIAQSIKAMLDNSKEKDTDWSAADQEKYDAHMREIDAIDQEITNINNFMEKITQNASEGNIDGLVNQHIKTPGAHGVDTKALRAYLTGGVAALNSDQLQAMSARLTPEIRNAMSTTTGSEGGYTVQTEYYDQLVQALKLFGGIRKEANIITTGTGASMLFPATDATSEEGEIVGQNTQTTNLDTVMQQLALDVYMYSSKSIALPFALIQDSMFDIEGYINQLLSMRIGRITARHFTNGTGSGQPRGIVTAATAGRVGSTGQTVSVTYDDLVELEHSVDPLYRAMRACWGMNDSTLKSLRKIKDANNRPIFVPGYEQGVPGGAPDTLMGRDICLIQDMPSMAANAKSIIFGNLKAYFIRQVMDLTLFRMTDSAYTLKGQVGFVGFTRQGGNMIDVGGAVKYYQNSAS